MNTKNQALLLFSLALTFIACTSKKYEESEVKMLRAKVDSTYAIIADLEIEQYKIRNKIAPDSRITAEIEAYLQAQNSSDKFKHIGNLDNVETDDFHHCPRSFDMRYKIISSIDVIDPQAFDLAIRNNDIVTEQIKMLNSHFGELDTTTVNAISFYEKLSTDEKKQIFFGTGKPGLLPYPALSAYFQNAYYFQRLFMYQRLNRYLLQTTFVNEFPEGVLNKTHVSSLIDDKQFDLKL